MIAEGRSTTDQEKRKAIYNEIQQIVAGDLPYINLWYLDNVLVHTNRVHGIELNPAGQLQLLAHRRTRPYSHLQTAHHCVIPSKFGSAD